jgi:hypothetical protein
MPTNQNVLEWPIETVPDDLSEESEAKSLNTEKEKPLLFVDVDFGSK